MNFKTITTMEQFEYQFHNGTTITANSGEDGITVNVIQRYGEPLIGTFTTFENMVHSIAQIVQESSQSIYELGFVARRLRVDFDLVNKMKSEEIVKMLLK